MKKPPATGKLYARIRPLTASAVMISLVFVSLLVVHSQDGPRDLKGESRRVVLVPNTTVDAGEIKFQPDSDHDGMSDQDEADNGTDPDNPADADFDNDGDGMLNGDEVSSGANPNSSDTDADGVSDGEEARLGYDPTDPGNRPPAGGGALASIAVTPNPVSLNVNTMLGQEPAQLRVIGTRSDGSTVDVTTATGTTYESLNEFVALVDDVGLIVGVGEGSATITVRNGELSAQTNVAVRTLTPGPKSSLLIPGYANAVDVAGDYAYIAAGETGLQVVDVSNRLSPQIVAALDTPGNADGVEVVGGRAYVADGESGLQIINVSTPTAPTLLGSIDTPGEAQDVAVVGTRAYVADGEAGLQIIDVSDPAQPALLGSADTPGVVRGLDVSGTLAVVADEGFWYDESAPNSVRLIDVADPATAHITGSLKLDGNAKEVVVRDSLAYVAATYGGTRIIDLSDRARPRDVGGFTGNFNGFQPQDLALFGRYLLLADQLQFNLVPIFDLADPPAMTYRGSLDLNNDIAGYPGTGIALDAQYVYTTRAEYYAVENGTTGTTRLFILQYQLADDRSDTAGIAPTAALTSPENGQSFLERSDLLMTATATDDVQVAAVQFSVNGVAYTTDFAAPYQLNYNVPLGATQLVITATAIDLAGNRGTSAPVTVGVIPEPAPEVVITSPADNTQLVEGQTIMIVANATDDGSVTQVVLAVNGVPFPADTTAPYRVSYVVPTGQSSLTIQATATDNFGKTTTVERTLSVVPDGLTTVVGRVIDTSDQPVAGAAVKVFGEFTTQTGADGSFSVASVPTIRGAVVARVTATLDGKSAANSSVPRPPVFGGVTDVGDVRLSVLPTAPTALHVGDYNGDYLTDVFVGYPDRQSQIYEFADGQLTPSADMELPFGAVSAGTGLNSIYGGSRELFAQIIGQPGSVINVAFNQGGGVALEAQTASLSASSFGQQGVVRPPTTIATGLEGESTYVAAGYDVDTYPSRKVLAFLSATDTAALSVRFEHRGGNAVSDEFDEGTTYDEPVALPLDDPTAEMRSLAVADVNEDWKADVLTIRRVQGSDARLVVYSRSSESDFAAPVEFPVTIRSTATARGAVDFALGSSNGYYGPPNVYVLGDDHVRVYGNDGTGNYTLGQELALPAGAVPTGISSGDVNGDSRTDIMVTTSDPASPDSKSLLIFVRTYQGNFDPPLILPYTAPPSAGDTRIGVGYWGGDYWRPDVVIVDGDNLRILIDAAPQSSGGGGS